MLQRALLSLLLALYVACAGSTTHVNDAGTWRQLTQDNINDAGTWRNLREVYVNDVGTWRLVFASSVNYTITFANFIGLEVMYSRGLGVGTLSPGGTNNLLGTLTIEEVTANDGSGTGATVQISGFGADPGQTGFWSTIVINGFSVTSASATGYGYSSGVATWSWNSAQWSGGVSTVTGVPYAMTINF